MRLVSMVVEVLTGKAVKRSESGYPDFHMNILRSFKKIELIFSVKANFDCEVLHCSRLLPRRMPYHRMSVAFLHYRSTAMFSSK